MPSGEVFNVTCTSSLYFGSEGRASSGLETLTRRLARCSCSAGVMAAVSVVGFFMIEAPAPHLLGSYLRTGGISMVRTFFAAHTSRRLISAPTLSRVAPVSLALRSPSRRIHYGLATREHKLSY